MTGYREAFSKCLVQESSKSNHVLTEPSFPYAKAPSFKEQLVLETVSKNADSGLQNEVKMQTANRE